MLPSSTRTLSYRTIPRRILFLLTCSLHRSTGDPLLMLLDLPHLRPDLPHVRLDIGVDLPRQGELLGGQRLYLVEILPYLCHHHVGLLLLGSA